MHGRGAAGLLLRRGVALVLAGRRAAAPGARAGARVAAGAGRRGRRGPCGGRGRGRRAGPSGAALARPVPVRLGARDARRHVRQADRPRGRVLARGDAPGVRRGARPERARQRADRRRGVRAPPSCRARRGRHAVGARGARERFLARAAGTARSAGRRRARERAGRAGGRGTAARGVNAEADAVLAARMRAQRLDGRAGDAAELVRAIGGVQAQEPNAAALSIRARTEGLTAADVEHALVEDRSIVRTWAMRGTIHLVAAEDAGWLHSLLAPLAMAGEQRALDKLEVPLDHRSLAVRTIVRALAGNGPLTRAELNEQLGRVGIDTAGQRAAHLPRLAALEDH